MRERRAPGWRDCALFCDRDQLSRLLEGVGRIRDDELRVAERAHVRLGELGARISDRAQQTTGIEPFAAQHRLAAACAARGNYHGLAADGGLRGINGRHRKTEPTRHLARIALAVRGGGAVYAGGAHGVDGGEAFQLGARLISGSDEADRNGAAHPQSPGEHAARRAGAQVRDELPVHNREHLAVFQPVQRHDVAHADTLDNVIGLGCEVACCVICRHQHAHRSGSEVGVELRRYERLAVGFMAQRRFEQIDGLGHADHALERLVSQHCRQFSLPCRRHALPAAF